MPGAHQKSRQCSSSTLKDNKAAGLLSQLARSHQNWPERQESFQILLQRSQSSPNFRCGSRGHNRQNPANPVVFDSSEQGSHFNARMPKS